MKSSHIIIILLLPISIWSQNVLTKDESIQQFMESNFNIKIAEQTTALAVVGANKSAVGYYPIISVTAGANYDFGGSKQVFQDGREIDAKNNLTQFYNAGLGISYNLYQGGERKNRLQQLWAQVEIADIQKRQIIEVNLLQLLSIYHQAAFLQKQVSIQKKQVELTEGQLKRTKINHEYGRGSKADLLTIETLLQRDLSNLISLEADLSKSKRALLDLMGDSQPDVSFTLESELEYNLLPNREQLISTLENKNVQYNLLQQNDIIIDFDKEIIQSSKKPALGLSSDYQYSFQDFGDGSFFLQQQGNGIGAGINLSWKIYAGGVTKNQLQKVAVRKEIQQTQKAQTLNTLKNEVYNLYEQLEAARSLISTEENNVITSTTNLNRIIDIYELGHTDILVMREAQVNLLRAESAFSNARYASKTIELQILQIGGLLLGAEVVY